MRKPFFSERIRYRADKVELDWQSERLLALLAHAAPSGGLCLDLGCGDGELRAAVEGLGYRWLGGDVARSGGISLQLDAHRLPLADACFDVVFLRQVLEHLDDPWRALAEVERVLRAGGFAVGSVAFLEPFHDSYFHFSHWGLERILAASGLEPQEIQPTASVFLTLSHHLVAPARIDSLLARLVAPPLLGIRRLLGVLYVGLRFGRRSPEYEQLLADRRRFPFKFAGHIAFVAQKPAVEGVAGRHT